MTTSISGPIYPGLDPATGRLTRLFSPRRQRRSRHFAWDGPVLDGLDEDLRRRHPGALIFEFHNSEDTQPMLGIDPGKPVGEYEVGAIGPGSGRAYEIGTWRNVDSRGRPGKYLIELPACYAPEEPPARERRRRRLAQLREAGYDYDPRWSHYLESRADVAASRRRGYLEGCLARKVADWSLNRCQSCR